MNHFIERVVKNKSGKAFFNTTAGKILSGGFLVDAISGIFKSPKSATPAPIPPPKAPTVEVAEQKAKVETTKKRQAISRNRTVFTDPLGLTPKDKSGLALKTLTGQ